MNDTLNNSSGGLAALAVRLDERSWKRFLRGIVSFTAITMRI
jgi:hypothetical protein